MTTTEKDVELLRAACPNEHSDEYLQVVIERAKEWIGGRRLSWTVVACNYLRDGRYHAGLKMIPPPEHNFVLGERVRHLPDGEEGVVKRLPSPMLPFGHDFSGGLTVEMPDGTWQTHGVEHWEKV